ncbi:hypothetical protein CcaverHIS631_0401590 [Cutaneotrichosporon cavernicola]|nr:hypothetical protein CcaverHIS631_0401590 [Cutaneotrichosporon cavernicola]
MQRPGHKINPREADPNEYITFIRSLQNRANPAEAEHILKAIAAQVKRIMGERFMLIGTLEEAAYNGVFAGRNWNHGQTVELVLRRPNGQFYPLSYMLSVMAHEMAHITVCSSGDGVDIKHMNHGPEFKKLNAAISKDIADLQAQRHYGDGFWSDGKRLHDGALLGAEGLKANELPLYVCGVTKSDARKTGTRRGCGPASSRARKMVDGEASHRSGRQTERRRKYGARNNVDMGESSGRLDGLRELTKEDHEWRKEWIDELVTQFVGQGLEEKKAKRRAADQFKKQNPWYRAGNTRGKQAKSKTAAADRAAAYERLLGIGSQPKPEDEEDKLELTAYESEEGEGSSNDDIQIMDVEDPHVSIEERRKELDTEHNGETSGPSGGLRPEWEEFFAQPATSKAGRELRGSDRSGMSSGRSSFPKGRGRAAASCDEPIEILDSSDEECEPHKRFRTAKGDGDSTKHLTRGTGRQTQASTSSSFSERDLIREQRLRALGGATTTLSGTSHPSGGRSVSKATIKLEDWTDGWACSVCSLNNPDSRTRCGVCEARPDGTGSIAQE